MLRFTPIPAPNQKISSANLFQSWIIALPGYCTTTAPVHLFILSNSCGAWIFLPVVVKFLPRILSNVLSWPRHFLRVGWSMLTARTSTTFLYSGPRDMVCRGQFWTLSPPMMTRWPSPSWHGRWGWRKGRYGPTWKSLSISACCMSEIGATITQTPFCVTGLHTCSMALRHQNFRVNATWRRSWPNWTGNISRQPRNWDRAVKNWCAGWCDDSPGSRCRGITSELPKMFCSPVSVKWNRIQARMAE